MADGFSRMKPDAKAAAVSVEAVPTIKSNEMDVEPIVDSNTGKFINVHLSPTEILLDTVIEKGDVYVSRLVEIPITTLIRIELLKRLRRFLEQAWETKKFTYFILNSLVK